MPEIFPTGVESQEMSHPATAVSDSRAKFIVFFCCESGVIEHGAHISVCDRGLSTAGHTDETVLAVEPNSLLCGRASDYDEPFSKSCGYPGVM